MIGDIGMPDPLSNIAKKAVGIDEGGQLEDTILRTDIARHEIDVAAFGLTLKRAGDEAKQVASLGAFSSILKYYGTELNKDRHEFLVKIGGAEALIWAEGNSNDGATAKAWLRTKANSIEGGTSEVMLNIAAKRILELPDA